MNYSNLSKDGHALNNVKVISEGLVMQLEKFKGDVEKLAVEDLLGEYRLFGEN